MKRGFCKLKIEALKPARWNYKVEDPAILEKLKANLIVNEQIENIIVRELKSGNFEVVNGNHRLKVFKDLGYKTVHCFNLGGISLSQAKRIAIETNETRFQNDRVQLAKILGDLVIDFEMDELVGTLPFTEGEINNLMDLSNLDLGEGADPPDPPDQKEGWVNVGKLFEDHGVTRIPDTLGFKIGEMIEEIADKNELTARSKFQVFDEIYANYLHNKTEGDGRSE